jgi:hypothetical protein
MNLPWFLRSMVIGYVTMNGEIINEKLVIIML